MDALQMYPGAGAKWDLQNVTMHLRTRAKNEGKFEFFSDKNMSQL
jgi:hypothetical protein